MASNRYISTTRDPWQGHDWFDEARVYFVQAITGGPIKIGFTTDLAVRLRKLQEGNPNELRVIAMMPGNEQIETKLHKHFSHLHIRGEWFQDAPELRRCVRKIHRRMVDMDIYTGVLKPDGYDYKDFYNLCFLSWMRYDIIG